MCLDSKIEVGREVAEIIVRSGCEWCGVNIHRRFVNALDRSVTRKKAKVVENGKKRRIAKGICNCRAKQIESSVPSRFCRTMSVEPARFAITPLAPRAPNFMPRMKPYKGMDAQKN